MSKVRKGEHQKLKMLILAQLFLSKTDDEHGLTMAEIIENLKTEGVNADRKTLYTDIEELREFGMDIIAEKKGKNFFYHIGSREFELPELKLLVDSVQSAKFITDKKSKELIKKLESLVSIYEGKKLQRQVVIAGRVKTINENIYYNVDQIHEAIGKECQIEFQYFQWNIHKEMTLRKNGAFYQVSPWALMWDDENYYLVAYDDQEKKIKHYRVDKMLHVSVIEKRRQGEEDFKEFDMPHYTKSLFGMFGGKETQVTLMAENEKIGILIDRFGKDIPISKVDDQHVKTTVNVAISNQFLGWIMSLGDGIQVLGPESVVASMKEEIQRLYNLYFEN
ncbi:WYL domain-containing protein [uncultured Faecalicoccus sp.]|uniref:helix-turn-helix transcriptional regulator n=1 Tax=uncultured Faecalicoccus sp. TaxID=1971760 RepID=UPI0026118013|nr:WYL domain-containing protein [uncultured Faecalicoccus sp.]